MTKTYSPIKIKNPTSKQYLVKVKFGQDVILTLTKEFNNCYVELQSDYLESSSVYDDNIQSHVFSIKPKFVCLEQYSNFILGEVVFDNKKMTIMGECANVNKNVIAVVNPNNSNIRISSEQAIKVIVFDSDVGKDWTFNWIPSEEFFQLRTTKFLIDDATYYAFKFSPDKVPQSVLWLSLNETKQILNEFNEVKFIGKVEIKGTAEGVCKNFSINVYFDFKKKSKVSAKVQTTKSYIRVKSCSPSVRDVEIQVGEKTFDECKNIDAIDYFESKQKITYDDYFLTKQYKSWIRYHGA